jgi:hypothetical protein
MKKIFYSILSFSLIWLVACEQVPIVPEEPVVVETPTCPADATAGTASFTKFVAIGNSFVAGVQGGALFTTGQNNSLAAILNKQFECVGAPATFNQPTIGASLGWNLFITQPFLADNTKPILGRMLLQYGTSVSCATGAPSPKPTPQAYAAGVLEALPNPAANPGFLYGGSKASLNNFAIPAITLGQALITETGAWSGAGSDPRFNPFYGRLDYPGGTSTVIGDAAAAGGSFFLFWLGLDDFFLYAANGGDPAIAPLTSTGNFDAYYNAALNTTSGLLASNANLKGVLLNYPDIWKMPHFTSVTYNPIPLTAEQASAATTGFADYNGLLDAISANAALMTNFGLNATDLQSRKFTFTASCTNKIMLTDESLTDLGPVLDYLRSQGLITSDEDRAALVPYEQARQSTISDIVPLGAGSIIGTAGPGGTTYGVSFPVGDRYIVIPSEKTGIDAARTAFNATVTNFAAANSTRVAVADISTALNSLVTATAGVYNNVTITPNINPPTGIYSEDGAHFNARGYAFLSRTVIAAINAKFGATIPLTNIANYSATGLPIP